MIVSVGLPTCMEGMMYPIPFATAQQVIEIAKHAESLGYHSVWGNDHMTTQRYVREEFATPPNFWELLVTLSFVAAATEEIRIATGVLIPAMRRDIVVVAKQLAALDQFSGGRLLVGVGVGAYREEFEALHPSWNVHRGDLVEESLKALYALFQERKSSWKGQYYHFKDVEMYPKPVQDPLPIYIGGNSQNAVRRAALYGQGWMGAAMPTSQLASHIKLLCEIASKNGRNPENIDVAPQFIACIDNSYEAAVDRFRSSQMYNHLVSLKSSTLKDQVEAGVRFEDANLIGTTADILEKIGELKGAGVTHTSAVLFPANSVQELKDQMQWFGEEVLKRM
jgi:probable F420-dependent oxidoreductase